MEHLVKVINRNKCIASFLMGFSTQLPNYPTQLEIDDVGAMKINLSRYTLRTMYFADNFVKNASASFEAVRIVGLDNSSIIVSDNAFFDFDAFVFSLKGLMEGNMIKRGKQLHSSVLPDFLEYSKNVFEKFLNPMLNPIRNELIHLNNYGTAIGSVVLIENGNYKFKTNYFPDDDLMSMFERILLATSEIIFNVSCFIIRHECALHGYPKKDIVFSNGLSTVKTSEFIKIVRM